MDNHTGIVFSHRPCPRHGAAMELVISEREFSTPIHWWCVSCHGLWSEDYFFFKAEAALPIRTAEELLDIRCPDCGGRNFSAGCDPTCCSVHECWDCKKKFFLRLHLVSAGEMPPLETPGTLRLETTPYDARPYRVPYRQSVPAPALVSLGQTTTLRTCDWHDAAEAPHLMELLHFPEIPDERFRFGWRCPTTGFLSYEYLLPVSIPCDQCWPHYNWPRDRKFFTREYLARLYCLFCRGLEFCNAAESGHYLCLTCKTSYRLEIEPADGQNYGWWAPAAQR